MKIRKPKEKSISDHLLAAIKDGNETAALFHLSAWERAGFEPDGDLKLVYEAFCQSCDAGFSHLTRSMLLVLPETKLDRSAAFNVIAHSLDTELLRAVIDLPVEDELWSMARNAHRFNSEAFKTEGDEGEKGEDFVEILTERAREVRRADWREAQSDAGGLAGRWSRRTRGLYESACDKWAVPIWSATAAPSLTSQSGKPESMEQAGWALNEPEETLLWGLESIEAWRLEFERHPEVSAWNTREFEALAVSWDATRMMLPWIRSEMELCRQEHTSERAQRIATHMVKAGAQSWIPFVLAWGNHNGFDKKSAAHFAPLLDVARVDVGNVGLVAANLDFGSFNARIARIVEEIRRRGGMDDAAVWVVHARWEDLFANKAWNNIFERSSFQEDFLTSRAFFEGEVLSLSVGAGVKKSRPHSI